MSKSIFCRLPDATLLPLSLAVSAVLMAQTAQADTPSDTPHINFGTIVINARATERPNSTERVNASTSNALRNATLVNEFLNQVPGVNVGGTSMLDQQIYIRGVGDKALKVTVDGARQENYFFHHAGNLALDPMFYKSAEISVGNNSVTLGNNAKGGGVAFTTVDVADLLNGDQNFGAMLKLGYSTNDHEFTKTAGVYGRPTANTDFVLAYGHRSSNGGEDARGERIRGDNLTGQNILAKFSYLPTDSHKFGIGFKRTQNKGNYPFRPEFGYARQARTGPVYPGHMNSDEYTLSYNYRPSDHFGAEFGVYHTEREYLTQGMRGGGIFPISYKGEVNGVNARVKNVLQQGVAGKLIEHRLIYGIEAYEKSTVSTEPGASEEKATSYGAYLEDRIDFGRFSLTPGVRYDRYKAGRLYGNEQFDKWSGALAGSLKLTDNVELFGGYTQFFSGPPSPESIHNNSLVYVNRNLKPETGNNTEYGINAKFLDVFGKGDGVNLSAKAFHTKLSDTVVTVSGLDCTTGTPLAPNSGTPSCRSYRNVGASTIDGYELSAKYTTANIEVTGTYEHAKSKYDGNPQGLARIIPKDVGDRFGLTATYYTPTLDVSTRYNHVESLTRGTTSYPSYATWDVFGSYRPLALPQLRLDAGIYNLTNKYYMSHSSTATDPEMGRNFKVSATYRF